VNETEKDIQGITDILLKLLPEQVPDDLQPEHRRRLEILIRTHLGQSQTEICNALKCSRETARYWMSIALTKPTGSWYRQPIGRPKKVNQEYLKRLQELVDASPKDYGYTFSRWTAKWLSKHLAEELGIEFSDRHVNRLLKQMGLSTKNQPEIKQNNLKRKIAIEDLQPSSLGKVNNLLWYFQNKN
jgi:putative transposase